MTALARGSRLLFATHNEGKVEEVRELLAPFGVTVVSAADLGLPIPEETEASFRGNAALKALAALRATGLAALADDSGLCVDALCGEPGVRTADWAEGPGGRDFMRAMRKTHRMVTEVGAPEPWIATFHCVLAFAAPGRDVEFFEGRVDGRLVWPLRGDRGHGYDPMFVPDGREKTFAEMTHAEKNALSHRGRALEAFRIRCFT